MKRSILIVFASATCAWQASGQTTFVSTLYPIMERAGCRNCHNVDGVASATRMHVPDEDAPLSRVEVFGRSLVDLVNPFTTDFVSRRVGDYQYNAALGVLLDQLWVR